VIDRLDTDPQPRPVESHISEISEAIEDAVMRSIVPADTTLYFSGGVDSTLLLTYAMDGVVPLTIVPDSPEFAAETGYAIRAAGLAGVELHEVHAPESRYPELLADVIEVLAAPAVHDLAPFELLGAEEAQGTIMVGTLADTLFGLQSRAVLAARWASTPILRATVDQAARFLPGSLGARAGRVAARAAAVGSDPLSVDGLGTVAYVFGDKRLVTGIAGEEAVRAALSRANERLHARVQAQTPLQQRFTANIELGHLVYMVTGAGGYQRLIARHAGKRIVGPYHAQSVIEAA
jgi:asparagine synthetase B (glutamine-hydrolysing)